MADNTGGQNAIDYAAQLDSIKFPEFTTKLITDTFDALIGANIRQQEGYIELLQAVSKSVSTYINDTKDDIGPEDIMQFLGKVIPPDDNSDNPRPSLLEKPADTAGSSTTLKGKDAQKLSDALVVEDNTGTNINTKIGPLPAPKSASTKDVTIKKSDYDEILTAVAQRIAANKYNILQQMVKLGMLRLVVDDGTIETKLNFHAWGSDYLRNNKSDYSRSGFSFRANAKTGSFLSAWVKASASTSYNSVHVSTNNTASGSNSGVDVKIFGGVTIHFHTDYFPLNPGDGTE